MIANSGSILREWQQQVVSTCFERRTGRHEQMPSVNDFWEVSGENAWIISWSCMRNSSTVSSKPMSGTTIKLGHIKGSGSGFRTHQCLRLLHQISRTRWSLLPCWVDCIITIKELHKPQKAYFTPRTSEAYPAEQNGRVNVRGICVSRPVFFHR